MHLIDISTINSFNLFSYLFVSQKENETECTVMVCVVYSMCVCLVERWNYCKAQASNSDFTGCNQWVTVHAPSCHSVCQHAQPAARTVTVTTLIGLPSCLNFIALAEVHVFVSVHCITCWVVRVCVQRKLTYFALWRSKENHRSPGEATCDANREDVSFLKYLHIAT